MAEPVGKECCRFANVEPMVSKQVFFEGTVQGVGFRLTTKRLAQSFEVVGWVRNLPDGRVELQVMGEADEVTAFLGAFEDSSLRHHIQRMDISSIPPLGGVKEFSIR
jgi:acylphosphatase